MRETKAQRQARAERDNVLAAAIPTGTTVESDLFGTMVLGTKTTGTIDEWENYTVTHSGLRHVWASGLIVAVFGKEAQVSA